MTKKHPTPVLSIYPGTRGFGYALFADPESMIDCGIYTSKPISNHNCLRKVRDYLEYYRPKLLFTRSDDPERTSSRRIRSLIGKIKQEAESLGISVKTFSREDIRTVFSQFGAKTKYEIAKTITTWIPDLADKMPKARKPWMTEQYSMPLFDAVSLAYSYYFLED